MSYLGDFRAGATIRHVWNTNGQDGASITRATNGTIQVYKDLGTTQDTGDITDTEDFDLLTGVHAISIDTSIDTAFYAEGHDYHIVLAGAVIDGKTVNVCLASFSIANRLPSELRMADVAVDTTQTPWEVVLYRKGQAHSAANELLRQAATKADGSNVTAETDIVGNLTT